ncbi:endothelin-converting enzyme 1-like isoform X3 [Pomacea canaliculata]|uniref:endothelin-converting enzyme 1-like isoform X3 n=1 Tax=Pomacea canaliculata TaxID=400727 RepID=UPI000D73E6D1|nr:endothelin-converting enzyme 1-like isoform X3 [Pomacea canaliculata]
MRPRKRLARVLVWIYAGRPRSRLVRTACTEENELLSANSIKMTDAPFGRSDSEDDIIEDYDDVVNIKGACCKDRTPLERGLLILIAALFLVIVGLAVGLTRPKLIPQEDYCRSPQCVQAASSIMEAMNPSMDPCEDFFEYACGGWVRNNPIPKGYNKWDRVQELSGQNLYVLKTLIESEKSQKGEAELKVRRFYRSCMADGADSQEANLASLRALAREAYDWSISRDVNASTWFFNTALERIHRLGAWPFFRVTVDVDERNPTSRYILKLDIGETVLPHDVYPPSPATSSSASHKPSHSQSDGSINQDDKQFDQSSANQPLDAASFTSATTTTTSSLPAVVAQPPPALRWSGASFWTRPSTFSRPWASAAAPPTVGQSNC